MKRRIVSRMDRDKRLYLGYKSCGGKNREGK
jgi:hypothetical protein